MHGTSAAQPRSCLICNPSAGCLFTGLGKADHVGASTTMLTASRLDAKTGCQNGLHTHFVPMSCSHPSACGLTQNHQKYVGPPSQQCRMWRRSPPSKKTCDPRPVVGTQIGQSALLSEGRRHGQQLSKGCLAVCICERSSESSLPRLEVALLHHALCFRQAPGGSAISATQRIQSPDRLVGEANLLLAFQKPSLD